MTGIGVQIALTAATGGAAGAGLLARTVMLIDKVGDAVDLADTAISAGGHLLDGTFGMSDFATFLPGGDLLEPWLEDEEQCFAAGTAVLTGQSAGGAFSSKRIEDLAEGDLVLTRAEDDPSAGLELRPVQRVFRSIKYELTAVEVLLADGTHERILTTGQHPFWVEDQGWTEAELLLAGQRLTTADGREATVLGVAKQAHPEGLIVYNIQVEGGHTYFVDDGLGDIAAIWVHNKRKKISSWGRWLTKQRGEGPPADMLNPHAHHIVYKGKFSGSPEMRKVLKESRSILREAGINFRTGVENVHWSPNRGHSIANAKKVLEELREVRGKGKEVVAGVLESIADRLGRNKF